MNSFTIFTLVFAVFGVTMLAIASSMMEKELKADNDQLRDQIARMTKVLAEHEQKLADLEIADITEPVAEERTPTKEEKADFDYNTGMSNIFNYSVQSGIHIGGADE